MLRSKTTREKISPNFAAWRLLSRKFKKQPAAKTVVTYLPPINAPVTSFSTIYQKLCREANMPFVNVTLDCGAAVNAFKLVWNYPDIFDNVVIHLGDFHFMKEIFSILGLLINGSGFEEIVFPSGLSTSRSLNGVIAGSHYNRCWKVHEQFAEALELLLYRRFLEDTLEDDASEGQSLFLRIFYWEGGGGKEHVSKWDVKRSFSAARPRVSTWGFGGVVSGFSGAAP